MQHFSAPTFVELDHLFRGTLFYNLFQPKLSHRKGTMVFQRHPNFLVSNKMMKVREEEITMGNLTLDIFMCIQLEKESAANWHKK